MPPSFQGSDDQPIVLNRRDFSGGVNTRQAANQIKETQCAEISNYDISIPGEIRKDRGITLIEDLGAEAGTGLFGYEPSSGNNVLVATHGQKLETWTGTGTFTENKTDFTTGLQTTIIKAEEGTTGDIFLVGNGTDNWFAFDASNYSAPQDLGNTAGTGSDSPPISRVGTYFRNRVWILKNNLGYFSDAYPAHTGAADGYKTAFDTVTNAFRMPVGKEMAAIPMRDSGLVFFGRDQVWGLNPSLIPDPTTDKPEKIIDIGCEAPKSVVQIADDILFLAKDGVRGLFRTQQDKLQAGQSFPLTYILKDQFESLSWAYIEKACAVYFNNMYLLAVPTNSSTTNNQVWIFYPALQCWRVIDDWNVGAWATMKVNGEPRLYFIDSNSAKVYRAFYGNTNNGTAITSTLVGREEDFGIPGQYKVGGELEISVLTINDTGSFNVYVSLDGQGFSLLGVIDIKSGNSPSLPIDLPFTLADNYILYRKFHLEYLGRFRTIQVKIEDAVDSASDIVFYGYTIKTFLEEYENE